MSVKIISASYLRQEDFKMAVPKILAPQTPLQINRETGAYTELPLEDLTKVVDQNLKMVLLTSPGERIMIPNFGVGMRNYLFENETTIDRGFGNLPPLRENILSQVRTYLPYITIQELEIGGSQFDNVLNVKIRYSVDNSSTSAVFNLTVSEVNNNSL